MSILEKYVEGLNQGDAEKIAALFMEDAKFDDGGARPFGFDDLRAEGKENIKAAFAGVFAGAKVKAEIVRLNPASMEYDVYLGDLHIPCIGTATVKDDLITEYIVRPR